MTRHPVTKKFFSCTDNQCAIVAQPTDEALERIEHSEKVARAQKIARDKRKKQEKHRFEERQAKRTEAQMKKDDWSNPFQSLSEVKGN